MKPSVLAQSVSDDGAVLARVVITDALWPSKWQHAFPLFEKGELEVKKGDYLCLVGRTGTGKSTLLLAIAGLLQWDVGKNLKCFHNTNVRIALVEQRPIVFEELSVRAGLRLVCACSADQSGDWATRVEDLLSQCDLAGLANQAMGTLSGGQRQRAAIALALGARPKILLLDEPMSSQDWLTREQLFEVLRDIRSSYPELAVIHVTHRWEDVVDVGLVTRVIELYCGEMFAASLSLK